MSYLRKLREKLTDTELVFCKAVEKHGDKVKAYKSAHPDWNGKGNKPHDYYRRSSIQNYLQEVKKMATDKMVLDKAWVLQQLQENAQLAKEGVKTETVTYEDGEEVRRTETIKPELANANKATELLGKHLNMFSNEVTISGLDEIVKGLQDKGDALASSVDVDPD